MLWMTITGALESGLFLLANEKIRRDPKNNGHNAPFKDKNAE
jgi:hypothetical protein